MKQQGRLDDGESHGPVPTPHEGPVTEPDAAAGHMRQHRFFGFGQQVDAYAPAHNPVKTASGVSCMKHELPGCVGDKTSDLQDGTLQVIGLLGEPAGPKDPALGVFSVDQPRICGAYGFHLKSTPQLRRVVVIVAIRTISCIAFRNDRIRWPDRNQACELRTSRLAWGRPGMSDRVAGCERAGLRRRKLKQGGWQMAGLGRRTFILTGLLSATALSPAGRALAQTGSLQDVGSLALGSPRATVFTAREIVTLDPAKPSAEAVAVVGGRIFWAGSLDETISLLGDQPYEIDRTFADHVIVPGFVAQHDHPVLAALTMSSEILSIEDWVLPSGTAVAVVDKQDFIGRLTAAVAARINPDEPVVTWGYHPAFYGPLTGADLDAISMTTPIIVWARSCHEMIFNTPAMQRAGITADVVAGFSETAKRQSNLGEQRFWEQGLFAVMPYAAPLVATPERVQAGLELTRDYMHAKGITLGNEPGGILARPVQDRVNAVFSSPDMPFRWSFMPDGKSLVGIYDDDAQVIAETEKLASWYGGMTSMTSKQVKLFADGAIYSQLMQVREPYLDGHEGEWMMDDGLFQRAFRVYWDAGYQVHIHVNGDAGLERVLGALEANLRRNPRYDHRTVLVHFAVSGPDQVARIKALGAIVSGNPYYVTALADQYGKVGLGPERADEMVRLGDLNRAGIRWSLHSDMPMAPGDPLFLMWCAVNRLTTSNRVAAPEQRVTAEEALRGVTIEAAYSLQLEGEIGTIVPGKRANFTILDASPLTVDATEIRNIGVWGTVMEGRVLPAGEAKRKASLDLLEGSAEHEFAEASLLHALTVSHGLH